VVFKVTNRATGSVFEVQDDETVLAAAQRQGVNLSYSCLTGHCVACRSPVITGECHYPHLPPVGLDPADREAGMALLCQAVPKTDLTIVAREIQALRKIHTRELSVEVTGLSFPVPDVALLELRPGPDDRLEFLAGQHLSVVLDDGRKRSFSIANAPHDRHALELHVRHVLGGGFTDLVFDTLKVGDEIRIEAPLGTFFLRERSPRPMICVAGGTGFAPIKAIIEETLSNGDRRPLRLYWGAETQAELYLAELAEDWAREHEHIAFIPVLSGQVTDWPGRTGLVHLAVLDDHNDLSPFDVYMTGPPALIDSARREFLQHGLPEHHLYYDSFEFAADVLAKMG
jgi:CDP-4-dehydro-6-deoxyglucose reductase